MESPHGDGTNERLVSRAVRVPTPSFRALVAAATGPRTVWDAPGEPTVVTAGAAAALTADGPGRFAAIRRGAEALLADRDVARGAARPRLFGGFAFHADGAGETPPANDGASSTGGGADAGWSGFPDACFVLPRVQVVASGEDAWLTVNAVGPDATPARVDRRVEAERERLADLPEPGPIAPPPGVVSRERTVSRNRWRAGVRAAVDRIEAGELRKVVLAQALRTSLDGPLSLPDVLARLGETYPDCYRFLIEPAGDLDLGQDPTEPAIARSTRDSPKSSAGSFFGVTPERLVRLDGRTVETGALAGTTGRGETPAEDERLAEELRASEKNVHEHELVVDAIREQLAPLASTVTARERSVRRLATVQHLRTPITAELAAAEHVLELVESLHPTPAVGGLPPERALETIRDTEPFDRGWYAAPVGWFDAAGDGSFAVALRSALVRDRTATLFAGVGIVADSDPDREWDEVQLKYRPILDDLERD